MYMELIMAKQRSGAVSTFSSVWRDDALACHEIIMLALLSDKSRHTEGNCILRKHLKMSNFFWVGREPDIIVPVTQLIRNKCCLILLL